MRYWVYFLVPRRRHPFGVVSTRPEIWRNLCKHTDYWWYRPAAYCCMSSCNIWTCQWLPAQWANCSTGWIICAIVRLRLFLDVSCADTHSGSFQWDLETALVVTKVGERRKSETLYLRDVYVYDSVYYFQSRLLTCNLICDTFFEKRTYFWTVAISCRTNLQFSCEFYAQFYAF